LLEKISEVINGEALYENDTFYVIKRDGQKVPFTDATSGFQKFGLLWKLFRNGLLESESLLFWDEPEASINPELISVLVDTPLELQRGARRFLPPHITTMSRNGLN
jgi:hypothetical protein